MSGHEQREPQRVQGVRRGDGIPRRAESVLKGPEEDGAHGQEDEQGEVGQGAEAQRQAPGGCRSAAHTFSGRSKRRRAQPMPRSTIREMRTSTIGNRAGRRQVVALGLAEDPGGRHLGLEREVARDQHDRAELADGAGEGQAGAGQDRGQDARQQDAAQHLAPGGAEGRRGFLDLRIELGQDRLDAAHAEGQGHEQQGGADAEAGAGQVDVEGAARPVEGEQREAGHDRGQREGQVDERADEGLALEVVAHEHERDGEAGDGVDDGDDQGGDERQLEGGDRLGRGDGLPEGAPAVAERVGEERGNGQEDE